MRAIEIETPDDKDTLITHLWELGTLGIIETHNNVTAFFTEDTDLSALRRLFPFRLTQVPENVIAQPSASRADYEPILAGTKFIIGSASTVLLPADRTYIRINAQNAFGSGSHESTQLVIGALEEHVQPTSVMLDVGSGSGILCAVAQHLGAKNIFACDIHLDSAVLTRHHAPAANAFIGSVDSVCSESIGLVVANISTRVIDALASHLNRVVKPEGLLILAGFIADHPPNSFFPIAETGMGEWRCWICKPKKSPAISENANTQLQPFASEWW